MFNPKRVLLSSVIFSSLILLASPPVVFGQLWETFPSMPVSRSDYTGNAVGTKIYLIQGIGAPTDFTVFDTLSGNYTGLATVPYSAHHSASAALDGKIYLAGGCGFGNPCPNFEVYDIATNTWTTLPDMPVANHAPTAKIVDDNFFVIGGTLDPDACQKYNITTNSWSLCADMPTGREHLSSAVYDSKIYVINGRNGGPGASTANEVYDPATNSWEILTDKPTGMSGGWGGTFNNKIFVIGGESPLTGANEWYDPATNSWTSGEDMPTPRHGLVCEPVGPKIYCHGGGAIQGGGTSAIVEVFDANAFVPGNCMPPGSGDWTITQSCTLESSASAPGNVIIQNGVVVTIPNGSTLDIDFANFGLDINSGGGVLIKTGGTIS